MKKIIALTMLVGSMLFAGLSVDAQTRGNNNDYQKGKTVKNNYPQKWDRNNRRVRVVTQTRIVRKGFRTYRETIQIKYFPNGRTETKVISRVRIR